MRAGFWLGPLVLLGLVMGTDGAHKKIKCYDGSVWQGKRAVQPRRCPPGVEQCLKYSDRNREDWFLMCDTESFCTDTFKQKPGFVYLCCDSDYCNSGHSTRPLTTVIAMLSLLWFMWFR